MHNELTDKTLNWETQIKQDAKRKQKHEQGFTLKTLAQYVSLYLDPDQKNSIRNTLLLATLSNQTKLLCDDFNKALETKDYRQEPKLIRELLDMPYNEVSEQKIKEILDKYDLEKMDPYYPITKKYTKNWSDEGTNLLIIGTKLYTHKPYSNLLLRKILSLEKGVEPSYATKGHLADARKKAKSLNQEDLNSQIKKVLLTPDDSENKKNYTSSMISTFRNKKPKTEKTGVPIGITLTPKSTCSS